MDVAFYMRRALALAERGRGFTRTNPLVGAVIVRDNEIIAEGYHHYYGGDHAEVDAIKNSSAAPSGGTMFVNLEPCSHYGKTPPCAEAIVAAGISKVCVAMVDPNPKVAGAGIGILKEAGVEVEIGLCEEEARRLNGAYLKYVATGVPFVIVKIAQTLDGKIADSRGSSKWITSEKSRRRVHRLRSQVDAVMVGGNTARIDNPRLTSHGVGGRDPLRIVVSRDGNLSDTLRIFADNDDQQSVLISTNGAAALPARIWKIEPTTDGFMEPQAILRRLGQEGVCSVLVEGGRRLFAQFISNGLVDKYIFVVAPKLLGSGTGAFEEGRRRNLTESINVSTAAVSRIEDDLWVEAYPR